MYMWYGSVVMPSIAGSLKALRAVFIKILPSIETPGVSLPLRVLPSTKSGREILILSHKLPRHAESLEIRKQRPLGYEAHIPSLPRSGPTLCIKAP